jgi:hypothetical protein
VSPKAAPIKYYNRLGCETQYKSVYFRNFHWLPRWVVKVTPGANSERERSFPYTHTHTRRGRRGGVTFA